MWAHGGDGGGSDEESTECTEEDQPQQGLAAKNESRIKNGINMSSFYAKRTETLRLLTMLHVHRRW